MVMIRILLATFMILSLFSCSREKEVEEFPEIKLPVTSELVTTFAYGSPSGIYIRIRKSPDASAEAAGMLWKNDIFEIVTKTADPENVNGIEDYWYMIKSGDIQGWVFGAQINLYEDIKNIK